MVDLDTIDYSNLNRQFLFRAKHVGRSKAEVARESVLEFPHSEKLTIEAAKDQGEQDVCVTTLTECKTKRELNLEEVLRCCFSTEC